MNDHSVGERPSRVAHLVERAAELMRADPALRQQDAPMEEAPPAAALTVTEGGTGTARFDEPARPDGTDQPQTEAESAALVPLATPAGDPAASTGDAAAPAVEASPPGLPMLDIPSLQRAGLVLTGARSRIGEEFRIAVTRALRALRGSRAGRAGAANLLMVTSARPNEGKSFSSLNVAASIAQNGLADVLLIDLDAKPRSLSALLGLGGRDGLLDLAVNWGQPGAVAGALRSPESLIARTAIEGLSVLPIGSRKPGAEGAITRAVSATLERISRRFPRHVIVLDTAPCLSTSDPSTLASMVDEVLLVVEAERTQRNEVEASLDLLKAASNITLILNKTRLTERHSFGAYYYFDEPV